MKKNILFNLFLALLFVCVLLASCNPQGGEVTTDPFTESITVSPVTTDEVTEDITEPETTETETTEAETSETETTEAETTETETVTVPPETTAEPKPAEGLVFVHELDGKPIAFLVEVGKTLPSSALEVIFLPSGSRNVKVDFKGWEYSVGNNEERKVYDVSDPPAVTDEAIHIYPVIEYSYLVSFGAGEGTFPEGAVTEFYLKADERIDPADLLARMPEKAGDADHIYPFLGFSLDGTNLSEFPMSVGKQPLEFTALYGEEIIEYTLLIHTEHGELIGGGMTNMIKGTQAEIKAAIESYSSYRPADIYIGSSHYVFKGIQTTKEGREWTLELIWERETVYYSVSLDHSDGEPSENIAVESGKGFILPEKERREDELRYYDFVGWRDAKGHLYNGGYELTVNGDASFTAEYVQGELKVYTVVFETEVGAFSNGAGTVVLKGHYGAPVIPPEPPRAEDLIIGEVVYTFRGWSGEIPGVFSENITFKAIYSTPHPVYFIDFYIDGEFYLTVPHYSGTKLEAPERPDFTLGKIFSGWQDLPDTMPAQRLRADASTRDAQVIYMLDGEIILQNSASVGSLVTLAAPAQKPGYTVSGWVTSDITLIEGNSFAMPEHDVCFNAVSTPNLHNVTYIIDGVTVYTDSVRFGEVYTVRGIEVRPGYVFSGWQSASGVFEGEGSVIIIPDRDVVFTASFTPCTYAVNYYLDGELLYRDEYSYGDEVILRPDEVQEGCSFFWSSAGVNISKGEFIMPAFDIDIYGAFSDGDNKIVFIVDGAPYGSIGVTAGQKVNLSLMPTKRGYTFTGWVCDEIDVSDGEFVMPEGDIVLRGSFIPNTYDVVFLDTFFGNVIGTSYLDFGASFSLGDRVYCIEGKVSSGWVLLYGDVLTDGDRYIMPDSEVVFGIIWENCLTIMVEEDNWVPYYDHLEYECERCRFDEESGTLYICDPTVRVAGESEGITVVYEFEKQ